MVLLLILIGQGGAMVHCLRFQQMMMKSEKNPLMITLLQMFEDVG